MQHTTAAAHGSRERIGPRPFVRTPVPDLDGLPRCSPPPPRATAPAADRDGAARLSRRGQAGRRIATRNVASGVNGRRSQVESSRSGAQPAVLGVGRGTRRTR